jgi:hypothetical protein
MLTIYVHLVPKLRLRDVITLLHLFAFMAWASKILNLSPYSRVLLEKLIARHLYKNCPIFYKPQLLFLFAEEIGLFATFCNIMSF